MELDSRLEYQWVGVPRRGILVDKLSGEVLDGGWGDKKEGRGLKRILDLNVYIRMG
jgi:hypothetical protein